MVDSLWGEEFNLPEEKEKTKKILKKIAKPKPIKEVKPEKVIQDKTVSLEEKLKFVTENVYKVLGKQKGNILVIYDKNEYIEYIQKCIQRGRIAIDTETNNSLDPVTCNLMGLCLYAPGEKQAYIPCNHRDFRTKERLENQLTEADIREGLQMIKDSKILTVWHNAKFDYQVLKHTCNIDMLPIGWDTLLGYKLIDENENDCGLKNLYTKFIDPDQEKYKINVLFENIEYADVDPEIFAYYAATDSLMTDKLYEFEMSILEQPDMQRVLQLGRTEMDCIPVTAEMEYNGVYIDQEYSLRLQEKYNKKLQALDEKISKALESIQPIVDEWRLTPDAIKSQKRKQTDKQYEKAKNSSNFDESLWSNIGGEWYKVSKSKNEQLDKVITPNTLASPTQFGIILYDVLKCPLVNKEKPYATGEDELKKLVKYTPLCSLMLDRRELVKIISTYIDPILELTKRWPDGRIRTHFNQYGAATGRFSSSKPINLQNIPSHNKEIRLMFRATPGYILISSDFSAQEPRLLSYFSNDTNMIESYRQGKDLYCVIASSVYHNKYEDNLELNPDGTLNPEGKKRRTNCKSLLLGRPLGFEDLQDKNYAPLYSNIY